MKMSYYGHDMDHDGEITTKDCGMFHEMMEEDEKAFSGQSYYGSSEPWTIYHSFAKGLLLVLFGGYILLLFNGVFPINGFTSVLALFSAVAFLRTLLL